MTVQTKFSVNSALVVLQQSYKNNADFDTILNAMNDMKTAIENYNNAITEQRIDDLLEIAKTDKKAMFVEYINNRFVEHLQIDIDEENKECALKEKQTILSFHQIDKSSGHTLTKKSGYMKVVSVFLHNIVQNIALDTKVTNTSTPTQTPSLNDVFKKELKQEFYNTGDIDYGNYSMISLEKQINDIVNNYILPDDYTIKLIKADVKYLQAAIATAKNGTISIGQERKIMNELFCVLHHRTNNLGYDIISKLDAHKRIKNS